MSSALLTYVLLTLCLLVFVASFFFASPRAPDWLRKRAKLATAVQLVTILCTYFVLRPGPSTDVQSLQAKAKQEDKLLFLSFHSNN